MIAFLVVTELVLLAIMIGLEVETFPTIAVMALWFLLLLGIEITVDKIKKSKPSYYNKAFYERCVKEGIKSISKESNKQKAILIQKQMGYEKYGKVEDLFNAGKELVEGETNTKKKEAVSKKNADQRAADLQKYKKSICYAEFIGREKRIAMMRDRLTMLEDKSKQSRNNMMMLTSGNLNATLEKEKSWGLAGGLAEGIAGSAAGVVAAMNVEAENQKIRERNAKRRENYINNNTDNIIAAAKLDNNLNDRIEKLRKKIQEIPLKIVSETNDQDAFEKILFGDTCFYLSKSGVLTIETMIKSDLVYIYDDVPAVIDGTIKGVLYRDNTKIGEALFVFPENGVSNSFVAVKGVCLDLGLENVEGLSVAFQPYHLWEIEK